MGSRNWAFHVTYDIGMATLSRQVTAVTAFTFTCNALSL